MKKGANRGPPACTVHLDRPRMLRLDFQAVLDLKEATGINLVTGFSEEEGVRLFSQPANLIAVVWACLRHEDEELTRRAVGRLLHPGNFAEVAVALRKLSEEFWIGNAPRTREDLVKMRDLMRDDAQDSPTTSDDE